MKRKNLQYYIAAAVSLLTFAIYLPALQNEFVSADDDGYVFENPHIRSFNAIFIKWAFFNFFTSNWHPLTWLSHALDYAIWGLNPLGHHLTSIILHAANTFVVALLSIRVINIWEKVETKESPSASSDGRTMFITGAVTALLFGLHPFHVESVAWVSERKDVLCAFFFLLSITNYLKYVQVRGDETGKGQSPSIFLNKYALFTVGSFILALMSKPMAVSLPFVLLILDWFPFKRIVSFKTLRMAFVEKLPLIALSLVCSVLTVFAQRAGGAMKFTEVIPLSDRLAVASQSLIAYLWKMVAPVNLMLLYPYPRAINVFSLQYMVPIALIAGITAGCIFFARRQKVWLSTWGYYVITMLPVLGIVQVGSQSMADRYTYLPSLGPFFVIGLAVAACAGRINTFTRWRSFFKVLGSILVLLVTIAMTYLTHEQIGTWENDISLWSNIIQKEPSKVTIANYGRGKSFAGIGQFDKAIADYDRAILLEPFHPDVYFHRGLAFAKKGEFDRAVADYNAAIALTEHGAKNFVSTDLLHLNRALAFLELGQAENAYPDLKRACDLGNGYACKALTYIVNKQR